MTKLRAVPDTNVYLSGIIFGGNSKHILDLAVNHKITAIASPSILLELSQKLSHKFGWNKKQILLTVKALGKIVELVIPNRVVDIVKDKSDNKIIEAGIAGSADYIVTGDSHLLDIGRYQKIKIVTPAQFLTIYLKRYR